MGSAGEETGLAEEEARCGKSARKGGFVAGEHDEGPAGIFLWLSAMVAGGGGGIL